MDDLVVWSDSKAWLWALADDLTEQLGTARSLELKAERTLVAPCRRCSHWSHPTRIVPG